MRLTQIMGTRLQGKRNRKKVKKPEIVTVSKPLVITGKKVIVSFLKMNMNRDVAISV